MNKKIFEFNGSAELYQLLIGTPEIMKQIIAESGGKIGRVEISVGKHEEIGLYEIKDRILYRFGDATTEAVDSAVFERPQYTVDDLRYGEKVENLDTQFYGADEMMGQKITLAGSYRIHEPFGMRPAVHFRPDLTNEEIAMLEGRGDDAEVVGT